MLIDNNLPERRDNLIVTPRPIELMLSDDSINPLTLILQPLEDIAEIKSLSSMNFSFKKFADIEWDKLSSIFSDELETLEQKNERFHDAPTFINRLANLAKLAGKVDREERYLSHARDLSSDSDLIAHRIGENLIARNLIKDAEDFFSKLNLEKDAYANLRLAFFCVQKKDLDNALKYVNNAVSIDPLDFGARLFEGSLHLIRGEYELAIRCFRFAIEDRQTSCPLFTNLALAYIYIGKTEKAFVALRKAVALDPSNENAISLLADLSFQEDRNEDAVPSLRCFVQFEHMNPSMWARLARALLELGEINEAIAALKRQGSIENTGLVWNNLGVAYHKKHDKKKAYEALKHAIKITGNQDLETSLFAARNFAAMLIENHEYKKVISFTKFIFTDEVHQSIANDPQLADMYLYHVCALNNIYELKKAADLCEQLLSTLSLPKHTVTWLVTSLIAYYSAEYETIPKALELVIQYEKLINELEPQYTLNKDMLINNIAFTYLEAGQIETAKKYLQLISHNFHKDPFATATQGLFHMRQGNVDLAEHLYKEAIHLAKSTTLKKRIRQKFNFELGSRLIDSNPSRARRYLQKVAEFDDIGPQIAKRALTILSELPRLK